MILNLTIDSRITARAGIDLCGYHSVDINLAALSQEQRDELAQAASSTFEGLSWHTGYTGTGATQEDVVAVLDQRIAERKGRENPFGDPLGPAKIKCDCCGSMSVWLYRDRLGGFASEPASVCLACIKTEAWKTQMGEWCGSETKAVLKAIAWSTNHLAKLIKEAR